jgi:hypothetical protein
MRAVAILGMGALVVACVLRRDALAEAVATVPVGALAGLAGLHLVSLVARSEAWRLSLAAIAGAPPSRTAIHAANAGAFVAGSLEAHAAMPARVALLRRIAPGETPHPAHVAVADVPIFLLEVAGAAAMLALAGAWWAPLGASPCSWARAWPRGGARRAASPCWPTRAGGRRSRVSSRASSRAAWRGCGWRSP